MNNYADSNEHAQNVDDSHLLCATEMVGVSGTTGMSKLIVFSSGDLKLTGLIANDSNAVNGYYIDKVIPLN